MAVPLATSTAEQVLQDEQAHVDSLAHTYFTVQIPIDKKIVYLGYRSFKPYFRGSNALELGSGDGDHDTIFS